MKKIQKNDKVKILIGKDKGKTGKVVQLFPQKDLVVVDGINKRYKHVKGGKGKQSGDKVEFFAPIHVSNIKMICPKCTEVVKAQINVLKDNKKIRICKKCKESID